MGWCLSKLIWGFYLFIYLFFSLENEVAYQEPIEILSTQKKKKKEEKLLVLDTRTILLREKICGHNLCHNFDVNDSK